GQAECAAVTQPRRGRCNGGRSRALRLTKGVALDALAVAVVVDVEAAREAEPDVERKRADERAGAIPAILEQRCERRNILRKPKSGILADAVLERIASRQDVRVRRQGD